MFHRKSNGRKPDTKMENEEPKQKPISPDELDVFATEADAAKADVTKAGTTGSDAAKADATVADAAKADATAEDTEPVEFETVEVKATAVDADAEASTAGADETDSGRGDADKAGTDETAADEAVENLDTAEVAKAEAAATVSLFMAKIKKLEAAVSEEHERTLRFAAELDNLRRRSAREQADLLRYSGLEVIRAILPAMDNMQRAIAAAEQHCSEDDSLLTGVRMVYQQLESALEKNNCQKINAEHEPFDPKFHEAISQMPSNEFPENTVLFVTQDGYMLADRVVRPSQVVVSKKA